MKFLLVRPPVFLKVAETFHAFLHLEPLDLECVAAGIDPRHETRILDLTFGRNPTAEFEKVMTAFAPMSSGSAAIPTRPATSRNSPGVPRPSAPA